MNCDVVTRDSTRKRGRERNHSNTQKTESSTRQPPQLEISFPLGLVLYAKSCLGCSFQPHQASVHRRDESPAPPTLSSHQSEPSKFITHREICCGHLLHQLRFSFSCIAEEVVRIPRRIRHPVGFVFVPTHPSPEAIPSPPTQRTYPNTTRLLWGIEYAFLVG